MSRPPAEVDVDDDEAEGDVTADEPEVETKVDGEGVGLGSLKLVKMACGESGTGVPEPICKHHVVFTPPIH